MTSSLKVALITGGEPNAERGAAAASSIGSSASFHQTNIASYDSLASASELRNESTLSLQTQASQSTPTSTLHTTPTHYHEVAGLDPIVDIDLKSVVSASYLAPHYFCKSPDAKDKYLVMTESCGGLYTSYYSPVYTATKHGFIGLMRSIAWYFWFQNKIRVNAICPGMVRANLLDVKVKLVGWTTIIEINWSTVARQCVL